MCVSKNHMLCMICPTVGIQLIHAYGEDTCLGHPDVSNVYRVTDARNTAISGVKGTYCVN